MTLPEDLKQLLLAFNGQGVEYLVVGGWAVSFYSEPRSTKDIDLFIRSEARNSEAVFRALAEFGAPLDGLTPADFHDSLTSVFQLGHAPARADILQSIDAVGFEEAWRRRETFSLDGISVNVISAEDLIKNKLKGGRLRSGGRGSDPRSQSAGGSLIPGRKCGTTASGVVAVSRTPLLINLPTIPLCGI